MKLFNIFAELQDVNDSFEIILGCVSLGNSAKGSLIQDRLDHSASEEPMNPPWERILLFVWSTVVQTILDQWSVPLIDESLWTTWAELD